MRLRAILGALLAPAELLPRHPEPGTAWCVGCSLAGYRTNVMRADPLPAHLRYHHGGRVKVKMTRKETP